MKKWKPITFENNKIPVWLSKIAPIEINAINFACFVFCRGKLSDTTRQHETTHFQQQLELLFVFQWILYGLFYFYGLLKYRNGKKAYYQIPFEQEAYDHQDTPNYLLKRKRYSWWKYKV